MKRRTLLLSAVIIVALAAIIGSLLVTSRRSPASPPAATVSAPPETTNAGEEELAPPSNPAGPGTTSAAPVPPPESSSASPAHPGSAPHAATRTAPPASVSGMPMPIVRPPAPERPPTIDDLLQKRGSIAFNTPDDMTWKESYVIQLLLDPSNVAPHELEKRLDHSGPASSARIRIAENVEAVLSGPAFTIQAITPQLQAISGEEPTEWRWEVTPEKKGTHRLYLTINAVLPSAGGERRRVVRTFDRIIMVRVSARSFTPLVVKAIGVVAVLCLLLLAFLSRRRRKEGSDGAVSSGAVTRKNGEDTVVTPALTWRQLATGETVAGRYRVGRLLGSGGMGAVYAANDMQLEGAPVALKTLLPSATVSENELRRLRREIQYARRIAHPNVCRIYDLGQHGTSGEAPILFVTMELIEGETLSARIARSGKLTGDEALQVARQLASALDATHDAGIVHRDLKPANVMLADGGARAVIMDFGLARRMEHGVDPSITDSGAIVGSPKYMAPEQLEGGELTAAADIYAFGLILYEMVTGTAPFEGGSAVAMIASRLHTTPPLPSSRSAEVDPRWDAVVMRCLARRPEDRFARAGEAFAAFAGEGESAPDDPRMPATGATPLPSPPR